MPYIQRYEGDIGQRTDLSAPIVTEGEVSKQGEKIAEFGQNVAGMSDALYKQEAAIKKTDQQLKVADFKNFATATADVTENHAIGSADPSGKDLVQIFDDNYQKQVNDKIAQEQDPDVKAAMQAEAGKVRSEKFKTLYPATIKMGKSDFENRFNENLNQGSTLISQDPYKYDQTLAARTDLINNSVLAPGEKQKQLSDSKKEFAKALVDGYIQRNDFNGAQQALTQKVPGNFDSQEREKYLEDIQTKQGKYKDNLLKDDHAGLGLIKQQQSFAQDKTFQSTAGVIANLNKNPQSTADDRQRILDNIDQNVRTNVLKPEHAEVLRQMANGTGGTDHPTVANQFYSDLGDNSKLSTLKDDIARAAANRDLSPETAMNMTKIVEARQITAANSVQLKDGDPRVKIALEKIDATLPKDKYDDAKTNKNMNARIDMKNQFWNNFHANGGDPEKALTQTFNARGGRATTPMAAFQLQNAQSSHEVLDIAKKLHSRGDMADDAYLQVLQAQKERLAGVSALSDRKNGINKGGVK